MTPFCIFVPFFSKWGILKKHWNTLDEKLSQDMPQFVSVCLWLNIIQLLFSVRADLSSMLFVLVVIVNMGIPMSEVHYVLFQSRSSCHAERTRICTTNMCKKISIVLSSVQTTFSTHNLSHYNDTECNKGIILSASRQWSNTSSFFTFPLYKTWCNERGINKYCKFYKSVFNV